MNDVAAQQRDGMPGRTYVYIGLWVALLIAIVAVSIPDSSPAPHGGTLTPSEVQRTAVRSGFTPTTDGSSSFMLLTRDGITVRVGIYADAASASKATSAADRGSDASGSGATEATATSMDSDVAPPTTASGVVPVAPACNLTVSIDDFVAASSPRASYAEKRSAAAAATQADVVRDLAALCRDGLVTTDAVAREFWRRGEGPYGVSYVVVDRMPPGARQRFTRTDGRVSISAFTFVFANVDAAKIAERQLDIGEASGSARWHQQGSNSGPFGFDVSRACNVIVRRDGLSTAVAAPAASTTSSNADASLRADAQAGQDAYEAFVRRLRATCNG